MATGEYSMIIRGAGLSSSAKNDLSTTLNKLPKNPPKSTGEWREGITDIPSGKLLFRAHNKLVNYSSNYTGPIFYDLFLWFTGVDDRHIARKVFGRVDGWWKCYELAGNGVVTKRAYSSEHQKRKEAGWSFIQNPLCSNIYDDLFSPIRNSDWHNPNADIKILMKQIVIKIIQDQVSEDIAVTFRWKKSLAFSKSIEVEFIIAPKEFIGNIDGFDTKISEEIGGFVTKVFLRRYILPEQIAGLAAALKKAVMEESCF